MPYGEKSTKKTIYSIEDNMFRFWYRFVPENSSIISRGAVELAYSRIAPYLSDYMGAVFEEICKQYLWKRLLNDDSEIDFTLFLVNVSGVMKVLTSVFLKRLLNAVNFLISTKSIFIFFQSPVLRRVALIRQMNSEMSA